MTRWRIPSFPGTCFGLPEASFRVLWEEKRTLPEMYGGKKRKIRVFFHSNTGIFSSKHVCFFWKGRHNLSERSLYFRKEGVSFFCRGSKGVRFCVVPVLKCVSRRSKKNWRFYTVRIKNYGKTIGIRNFRSPFKIKKAFRLPFLHSLSSRGCAVRNQTGEPSG